MNLIATVSHKSEDISMLNGLVKEGISGIRINLAHNHLNDDNIKSCVKWAKESDIDIIYDLRGYSYRVSQFLNHEVRVIGRDKIILCLESDYASLIKSFNDDIVVPIEGLDDLNELSENEKCYLTKNNIAVNLTKRHMDYMEGVVINAGGIIRKRNSIILTGMKEKVSLTLNDIQNINDIDEYQKNILIISCCETDKQIKEAKRIKNIKIFAKIETKNGIKNLKKIFSHCDGIIIDRRDLGSEVGFWNYPKYQKKMMNFFKKNIDKSNFWISGGILESLSSKSYLPSIAEINDLTQLIESGVNGFVFSETHFYERPKRFVKSIKFLLKDHQ